MEGILKRDDADLLACCRITFPAILSHFAGYFESTLVGLCTGIGKKYFGTQFTLIAFDKAESAFSFRELDEELSQLSCPFMMIGIGCMQKLPSLFF